MKLTLTDVSQQRIRKEGILCSSVAINKNMILLHKVDKDVVLDKHNHPHAQFGYCFYGNFDFEVEGNCHSVGKGHSYLLSGGVYHAAVATTDYYSVDVKVMLESGTLSQQEVSDVFECAVENKNYILKKAIVGSTLVQNINYLQSVAVDIEIEINRNHYFAVSAPCLLRFEGVLSDFYMEPMKIYQLEVDKTQFSITADTHDVEVMLITC